MKTYPIMLPSHGGEDVQAATLTEYQDGSCSIETGSSITTDHKAAAIDVIKRRWPAAYIAEAVRDDTPPAEAKPTLTDLLKLAQQLTGSGILAVDVEYNSRYGSLILYACVEPRPKARWLEYEICYWELGDNELAAAIQAAIDWLTDLHKQYGNPAA